MQEKIFDMLLAEEEISWRSILVDLVKTEQMDPWDVNVTLLTQKYIDVIKEMQEHDLKISGKIILAAAILLKLKCSHLLDKDVSKFDALINPQESLEELEEEIYSEMQELEGRRNKEQYTLIPRNPQPRNRKVSIQDLVQALQRAMASKKRVLQKMRPQKFNMPKRHVDIMEVIRDVYHKLEYYTKKDASKHVSFTRLLPPKASKEDKVYTFLPLLILENQHKVEMEQEQAFSEIDVHLVKKAKMK